MIQAELFDTVELLVDLPEHNLPAGARGAVVEQYDDGQYEIEFANDAGETQQLLALPPDQFLVVWRSATQAWVSLPEQVAQLTARLHEREREELMDFAHFLFTRQARRQLA